MAASSSLLLLYKPTCNFNFQFNSARFRSSTSVFTLNRRRIWSESGSKSMADLTKTNARRDGEERVQALEQEAFIDNSSVADAGGGIGAVANRLVGIRIL